MIAIISLVNINQLVITLTFTLLAAFKQVIWYC